MSEAVLLNKIGAVAEIILNRPDALNAMNLELIDRLREAIQECRDRSVRVVVIRGNGRSFCAGGDIRFFQQKLKEGTTIPSELPDRLHEMIEGMRALEKPVIASVHGACAGAGTSLALACDLVIAAEDALFNLAYVGIGLSPDGSSTFFLPRHVGMKKALEIFLLAPTLKAHEAQALGLINWVVPLTNLQEKTNELLARLSEGPTQAFGRVKKLVNQSFDNSLHDQLAFEGQMIGESCQTHDFREGIAAFLEKRKPSFQGN